MGYTLLFRRYAPFAKFGFGFEGDHRVGPSTSMLATARTIGVVPFARGSVGSVKGDSSGTEYVGGGDWLRKMAGRHKSHVSSVISKECISANTISFRASTAGANPMVPGAPDIDTIVDFCAEWIASGLRFSGVVRGDDFPNAEVFVLDSGSVGCLLFDGRTTGGQDTGPIIRLAGSHETQILGAFSCAVPILPSGAFVSPKNRCPVTMMESAARRWRGAGGQFNGAGATGRW
jgi:hypothetical protein